MDTLERVVRGIQPRQDRTGGIRRRLGSVEDVHDLGWRRSDAAAFDPPLVSPAKDGKRPNVVPFRMWLPAHLPLDDVSLRRQRTAVRVRVVCARMLVGSPVIGDFGNMQWQVSGIREPEDGVPVLTILAPGIGID